MKMSKKVEKFFVEMTEGNETYYDLNNKLSVKCEDKQLGVQFLVEVIRFWHMKKGLFCGDGNTWDWKKDDEGKRQKVYQPENEWSFSYKTPSDCGGCVRGQELLDKIFGSRRIFNSLPFVTFRGDRLYAFRFDLMKCYAEKGHDAVVELMEAQKQERARKKAEEEAQKQQTLHEEQKAKLRERFGDAEISDDLYVQITKYAENSSLVIVDKDTAVVTDSRSDWGSSGGIGYYDQIRVFYGQQSNMQEWQWRDRYSASKDRPSLAIHGIGKVDVAKKENMVSIEIELINNKYGNRSTTFSFKQKKLAEVPRLSVDDQAKFQAQVEKEIELVMSELNRLWECKPEMLSRVMPTSSGYTSYRQPSIKQTDFRLEIGVAVFVTEEQIDHRASDPQIRYELFVVKFGEEKVRRVTEDHGYESEGGAFLAVLDLNSEQVVVNTKSGKATILLT